MNRMLLALALLVSSVAAAPADEPHVLKIATLAPEGSLWMNLFHDWARAVEARSSGSVKIKFYAGGVAGDERDVVRKMRLGQIGGAAVTSIGLGLIQPEVRVLEVPMLIRGYAELDFVRARLDGELRKKFEDKGYVLLAWGDVGPIHLFSNTPVRSKADLLTTKLWEWNDDPISRTLFQRMGAHGVPLGAPDVLPSLSTGMIDASYGSPLAVLAMQWHTRLRYMTSLDFGQALGASVLTRKEFERLSPVEQRILLEESQKLQSSLLQQIRAENDRALAAIKRTGMQVIDSPKSFEKELETFAVGVRGEFEPSLYSHDFRMRVEKLVAEYRAQHPLASR
ncbi:MAG TPA: TRAP transporter substrate-binding protein DctP [Polyangia bacterium]|nr:TRAP transporter substrate-binding protein DctP [Polyangia bacterium]